LVVSGAAPETELIAIASQALLLRGFQSDDGIAYVQEWRCMLDPT
jgi:hypothetical protein